MEQTRKLGFLDLPFELRVQIYELVWADNSCKHDFEEKDECAVVHVECYTLWEPKILGTCKTIREEATPIFYSACVFDISIHGLNMDYVERWLKHLGVRKKLLKRVVFHLHAREDENNDISGLLLESIFTAIPDTCQLGVRGHIHQAELIHEYYEQHVRFKQLGLDHEVIQTLWHGFEKIMFQRLIHTDPTDIRLLSLYENDGDHVIDWSCCKEKVEEDFCPVGWFDEWEYGEWFTV